MNELLLCYLLALYGLSIGLFDEYLVIPMLVCAIFYKSWASWAFMLLSSGVMVIQEASQLDSVHPFLRGLPRLAILGGNYGWADLVFHVLYAPMVFAGQLCIVVLLVLRWRDRFGPETTLRTSATVFRCGGLVLITWLPWVLPYAVHRVSSYILR